MPEPKYIQQTLTLPETMPLFNYNLNFQGLRKILEPINIQVNTNSEDIQTLDKQLKQKMSNLKFEEFEESLGKCLNFGIGSCKVIDGLYNTNEREQIEKRGNLKGVEKYLLGMDKNTRLLEFLVGLSKENQEKIESDDKRHEKNIQEWCRRIDNKVEAELESVRKSINLYFSETNKKLSSLQIDVSGHKRETASNFESVNHTLIGKINDFQLKSALGGLHEQIKSSLLSDMENDHIKRLASLQQYSDKLKQHAKESELRIKLAKQSLTEMSEKVSKLLPVQTFQVEKHKIYDKLSEYKIKIDDLSRKNVEFIDLRKKYFESNEKAKQNFLEIEDQFKKMGDKNSSFKKMEDIGSILESLDPHLICEINNEVKIHQKQIEKMSKKLLQLENASEMSNNVLTTKVPEVNTGQTASAITKIIKEYMSNIDFEGRMKKNEKDIQQMSRKNDGLNDLEKKFFMLSKDLDIGTLTKELKRKSDEETTRKDFKVMDAKIEKLFEFYKQVRREIEQLIKRSSKISKQPVENASLTTKKLYGPNCLSCTPKQRPNSSRTYSIKNKRRGDLEDSFDQIKNTMYFGGSGL